MTRNYFYLEVCTTEELESELRLWYPQLGLADAISEAEDLDSEGQRLVERQNQTGQQAGGYYEVVCEDQQLLTKYSNRLLLIIKREYDRHEGPWNNQENITGNIQVQ